MLGKHVNVSARNKTLFMKFLRVFLAVVLLGLMIPHGISASLNAYAGDAEEKTTETTDPVVTEEDPVAEEEVTPADPVPAAPVVGDTESNDLQTATIFVDFRAYGNGALTLDSGIEPLPNGWVSVSDTDGFKGIQRTVQWDPDQSQEPPTYGQILGELDVFVQGGERENDIVKSGIPDGVDLFTFAYKIGQNISLNAPVEANPIPKNVEPELVTSITIDVDGSVDSPELWYSRTGKINVQYEGWPNSKEVTYVKYKSGYSIDTGTGHLHATFVDTHEVDDSFSGWCKAKSPYTFTKFTTEDQGEIIVPDLKFTAEFSSAATINFKTDLDSLPTGITFYKWDTTLATPAYVPADFTTATVDTANNFVKSDVHHGTDGYVGGITIDGVEYAFKINETAGLGADYEFSQWMYSSNDSDYYPVEDTETTIGENKYFKACFKIRLSFGTNDATRGTVQKSETDVTDPVYLAKGTPVTIDGNKVTINSDEYIATVTDEDLYAFIGWENNPSTFNMATPTLLQANFAVTPVVTLDLDDPDYNEYLQTPQAGFNWGDPVPALKVGTIIKKDSSDKTKLLFDYPTGGESMYLAALTDLGKHYLEFGDDVWYIKTEGEEGPEYQPIDTTGITLEDGDSYSIVIQPDVLDLLTLSGKVQDVNGTGISGAKVTADVTIEGSTETKYATTDSDGDYEFTDLPNNVAVKVYARSAEYTPNDLASFTLTEDKDDANITLTTKALTFAYGTGVSGKDWKDTTGVKTISSSADITSVSGVETYNFADQSTLSITVCQNDVVRLYNYTGDINNNALSFGDGAADPWQRSIRHTVTTAGQSTLTITFSGENHVDFIAIEAAERTVTFEVNHAEGSVATGYFNNGSSDVTSLTVSGMGATYNLNSDATMVTFVDGTTTTNIQALASQDAGYESIFREWVEVGTTAVPIVDNITLKARFVQENVALKFDKGTSPVEADGTTATTIKMDSIFSQERTDSTHANAIFTLGSTPVTKTINIKDTDKVKYKFAETVFSGVESGKEKIDENNYSTIEKDGLKLTYSIIERTPIDVTIDLRDGHLVGTYTFPDVPATVGGLGAWTHDASTDEYKNKFYEEYPITTIVSTYLTATESDITKDSGFFNETWEGATEGTLSTENNTWTANYDDAGHLTGIVYTSQSEDSTADGAIVELSNSVTDDPIAPGVHSVKYTTGADGKYDLKVYAKKLYDHVTTGTLTAGNKTLIQKDVDITDTNWNADGTVGTQDFSGDLALDQGYSFFASDIVTVGQWYARYYEKQAGSPSIFSTGLGLPSDGEITLSTSNFFGFYTTASLGNIDSGHEMVITTSATSGHFKMVTQTASAHENAEITSGKEFVYTVWASGSSLIVYNADGENDKKISRVDYRKPWDEYISIHGKVTDNATPNPSPLDGIDVTYTAPAGTNALVESKTTFDDGNYYLIIPKNAGGLVMFVDPWTDPSEDDHLDERIRLADDGTDTQSDITETVASGDTANPAMIPAVHITGHIDYQVPGSTETHPAVGANVSYSSAIDVDPPSEGWGEETHGYAYTDANGNYSYKIKKHDVAEEFSEGYLWFLYTDSVLGKFALDGHVAHPEGEGYYHNEDVVINPDGPLVKAGATVQIKSDSADHDGFEVIYYTHGRQFDKQDIPAEGSVEQTFAADGKFFSGYDSNGRNILKYVYDVNGEDFVITIRPIAKQGTTYWAWRCTEPGGTQKTLLDNNQIEVKTPEETGSDDPYIFAVDYTDGTEVTVGGDAGAGHAGWDFVCNTSSGGQSAEPIRYVFGTEAYTFTFPISTENANAEQIKASYDYNGVSFNLNLSTTFTGQTGPVDYIEKRAFTPIPAEGYMVTGIAVNGVDLVAGEASVPITDGTGALTVVAKYAPIPVVAQTGDNNNFWWLFALVAIALAGAAYAGTRKQKGIRR